MGHFAEVTGLESSHTRWKVRIPGDGSIVWDAGVCESRPGEALSWRSHEGSDFPNEGNVSFRRAPAGKGTEVSLQLRFGPPGRVSGHLATQGLKIIPKMIAEMALRRFKSMVETGELPTLDRNPSAR